MKRLLRILLTPTLLLTLILFLATTTLWIRSYCVGEQISWRTDDNSWFVTSGHGEVMLVIAQGDAMSVQGQRWNHGVQPPFPALPTTGFNMHPLFLGFQSGGGSIAPDNMAFRAMAMPWWPVTVLSGVSTLLLARSSYLRRRRDRRQRSGHCVQCGYDLRATPDRCPECGAAREAANPSDASPAAGD